MNLFFLFFVLMFKSVLGMAVGEKHVAGSVFLLHTIGKRGKIVVVVRFKHDISIVGAIPVLVVIFFVTILCIRKALLFPLWHHR